MNIGSNILCVIYNHNKNENSKLWLDRLLGVGFDAYILDSGSDEPIENERVLKFGNIYWGGMFDETLKLVKEKSPEWVFHVDDDILIDDENFKNLLASIERVTNDGKIGIYQPSTTKESHNVWTCNKNKGTNDFRFISVVEEWMWLIKSDILFELDKYGFNYGTEMKYGWGVGMLFCKKSLEMGYSNVVDDSTIVVHPPVQSNYNGAEAGDMMRNGFKKLNTSYIEILRDCDRMRKNKTIKPTN